MVNRKYNKPDHGDLSPPFHHNTNDQNSFGVDVADFAAGTSSNTTIPAVSDSKTESALRESHLASSKDLQRIDSFPTEERKPRAIPVRDLTAMSKLSQGLKALINAPFARPGYTKPSHQTLKSTFTKLAQDASSKGVGTPAWLTFGTATAMTMNAPDAMLSMWQVSQTADKARDPVMTAELQREVGLKCISFNGIPRSINCLGAFHGMLPEDVKSKLSTKATRSFSKDNIEERKKDGLGLWDGVYYGFERKLLDKLAESHPNLPVHIINSHYANLLSNPKESVAGDEAVVGRVLTSLVAIACLRAQTGVGPQVVSHVFGLRKAYERGEADAPGEVKVEGGEWLSTEEGNKWIIEWIDDIVRAIGESDEAKQNVGPGGTTFAPGIKSKL